MSRRPGRARRPVVPVVRTLAQRFAALFQGSGANRDVWFDASNYQGLISAPTAFVDYNDPTHLLAITGTLPIAADAALGNALAAQFSTTQVGVSSRAASDWSFLNNTPCEVFCVLKPLNTTFAIWWETSSGTANGANLIANTNVQAILSRDIGTQSLNGVAVAANTPVVSDVYYDTTANPARNLKLGGQALVTGATIANSGGTATAPLTLGARTGGSLGMTANWRSLYAFHRVLTTAERAVVAAKILADTSLAA